MKTIIALCLLLGLIHCAGDTVVERSTRFAIPTKMDGCVLKTYGSYKKYFTVIAAGSFYECHESGVVTSEIISSKLFKGLWNFMYRKIIGWVLDHYVNTKTITNEQKGQVIQYMEGFGDFETRDIITGVYDYRSKKVQLYFERSGVKKLKGTYNLDHNSFRVYKNLLKENVLGLTEYK
jgi:hypothetical protein